MKAPKKIYVCTECDYQSAKWMGRCPSCQAWNSFTEETYAEVEAVAAPKSNRGIVPKDEDEAGAVSFDEMEVPEYMRSGTGMGELDRVLGGGIVRGSVILLSGEPGIGKSTLFMQISTTLAQNHRVLYVSGEESRGQLKLRADRLGAGGKQLFVMTATSVERILSEADKLKPDIMIVDSIQTMCAENVASAPGSISQVKEAAARFIYRAKGEGTSVLLVGHVNKEGGIAGPKVLEHMVDGVLYFEGEKTHTYRIIRAIKNRYGSTNEIGVFEMTESGLHEVPNPSEMLLAGRPKNVSGNCAVCIMEGSRPIIAEVQALASATVFPAPRRTTNGMDYNRICLLLAVLEKRLGLRFSTQDIYMNVIGGLHIDEPAADLAAAMALMSGLLDKPIPDDLIAIGEIGLAGECRSVADVSQRVHEAGRLGFTRVLLPYRCLEEVHDAVGNQMELIGMRSVYEGLRFLQDKC